ncbi:MAG: hypothetical protein NTV68_04290 [Methanomicrobiales archaeon]|jgi:hypothetical protein|nr:hypothetical protein [Methanomicrobiales archaeon]
MMNTDIEPKPITHEIARAYEIRSGLFGICDFFVKLGHFKYVEENECRIAR